MADAVRQCKRPGSFAATAMMYWTVRQTLTPGMATLEMIGRLLGHARIGATRRYPHLIVWPLRAGVNAVGEILTVWLKLVSAGACN